ncbi:hypothetical protein [Rhizobium yanglingense]
MLDAAALGFLGMGAQPPTPEWGTMLGRSARVHPARLVGRNVSRALPSSSTVLAINLMGDGLRDALDPEAEEVLMPLLDIQRSDGRIPDVCPASSAPSTA